MSEQEFPVDELFSIDSLYREDIGEIESQATITPAILKKESKQKVLSMMKREHLREVMPEKPEKGYTYHVVSNGQYDFWTWVPVAIDWIGHADELYVSTWTLSRNNCVDLLRLIDEGRITRVGFITGLYFKRRESAVYAQLLSGLESRGHRYAALKNHAKVVLLHAGDDWITIEGSANLTSNPRIEQYVLTNDVEVYQFHRRWMNEVLNHGS